MAVQPLPEQRGPLVRDGLAVVALGLAGLLAVVMFLPAEGWLATPLHVGLVALLGQTAFVLPIGLLLGSLVMLQRHTPVPRRKLIGLGLLALSVLPAEQFVAPNSAGLIGEWLAGVILGAVGGIGAAFIVLPGLAAGTFLVFSRAAH
jgi:hypothetical protein